MTISQSHWISATTKLSLSDEYYHLYDGRTERQVFSHKRWYDDDPARTKRLFLEMRSKIMMKYPSWNAGPGVFKWGLPMCQESNPEIFDETDPKKMRLGVTESLPLRIGELPPVSAYRRPAPAKGVPNFDRVRLAAPSLDNLGSWPLYHFVSASWKAAIETVESGVHEFHPLEVRFTDASFHHFIFRPMHFGRPIDYALSDAEFDGDRPLHLNWPPKHVTLRRRDISGKHFIWNCSPGGYPTNDMFLSKALAEHLRPLLPAGVYFVPADLI